jgi:hypothetical protein
MTLEASRVVKAPRPLVWQVFSDLVGWPSWNPHCHGVSLQGGGASLEARGCDFSFTLRPLGLPIRVAARVLRSTPGELVAWEGRVWGIRSLHSYHFRDLAGKGTLVRSEELLSGLTLLPLRLLSSPKGLGEMNQRWLAALAAEAERRAGSFRPPGRVA